MPGPETLCVYQFKVVLRGISPMIWRRLLLRSDHSIADLHYTIQIAMGWSDAHLHRFHIHGKDYGVAHEGGLTFSDDPDRVRLAQFGFRLRERFLYEYDFYDNWKHDIRLEKVLPSSSKRVFPLCTGGQGPVPLEDCGGARAYMEEGDPRWRTWWDAMPREDLRLIAETVKRFLDSSGDRSVIGDRESMMGAVERSPLESRKRLTVSAISLRSSRGIASAHVFRQRGSPLPYRLEPLHNPRAAPAPSYKAERRVSSSTATTPFRAVYRVFSCHGNHTHTKSVHERKNRTGQANAVWVIGEGEASLVRNALIFAVDVKTM